MSETIERMDGKQEETKLNTAPVVGLDAGANTDAPNGEGRLPNQPQTLKTFTIDMDDAWALP